MEGWFAPPPRPFHRPLRPLSTHMEVAAVTIYPIKSCKGMAVTEAAVAATGFQYDRQWMVVAQDCMGQL